MVSCSGGLNRWAYKARAFSKARIAIGYSQLKYISMKLICQPLQRLRLKILYSDGLKAGPNGSAERVVTSRQTGSPPRSIFSRQPGFLVVHESRVHITEHPHVQAGRLHHKGAQICGAAVPAASMSCQPCFCRKSRGVEFVVGAVRSCGKRGRGPVFQGLWEGP